MNSVLPVSLILIPIVAALVVVLMPSRLSKTTALLASLVNIGLSLFVFSSISQSANSFQWGYEFLSGYQLNISIVQHGVSVLLTLLVSVLLFISLMSISGDELSQSKGIHANLLLLASFLTGVFSANDLISFYIFFESALIPMYFLIGIWGGTDRVKANYLFFIYTMVGSLLLLISIMYIGLAAAEQLGNPSIVFVSQFDQLTLLLTNVYIPDWIFIFVIIAFGIKSAMFPFHSWLPGAYVQASYPALIMLSGAMAKMGTYGFLIFGYYFFQDKIQLMSVSLSVLAVIGIVYAAWIASTRKTLKEIIAFSSMSHMGFILLGIFAGTFQSLQGSVIQMFNHGISTALLFLMLAFLAKRHEKFNDMSGFATSAPVLSFVFVFGSLSAIGLPGLNGFIGEFNILLGSFRSEFVPVAVTAFAAVGVILAAVYMLRPIKDVFYGVGQTTTADLTAVEMLTVLPLVVFIVWIGVNPQPFFDLTEPVIGLMLK